MKEYTVKIKIIRKAAILNVFKNEGIQLKLKDIWPNLIYKVVVSFS